MRHDAPFLFHGMQAKRKYDGRVLNSASSRVRFVPGFEVGDQILGGHRHLWNLIPRTFFAFISKFIQSVIRSARRCSETWDRGGRSGRKDFRRRSDGDVRSHRFLSDGLPVVNRPDAVDLNGSGGHRLAMTLPWTPRGRTRRPIIWIKSAFFNLMFIPYPDAVLSVECKSPDPFGALEIRGRHSHSNIRRTVPRVKHPGRKKNIAFRAGDFYNGGVVIPRRRLVFPLVLFAC
jgi:hypothetical protein